MLATAKQQAENQHTATKQKLTVKATSLNFICKVNKIVRQRQVDFLDIIQQHKV